MIGVAEAVHLEGLHDFSHGRSERQRRAELVPGIERVVEVFDVQVDSEPGIELPVEHERRLGDPHRAAGQPAADGLIHQFRLHTGLRREDQRLGDGRDVQRHDHLIGQLGDVAHADVAHAHNRGRHRFEHRQAPVEDFLFASHHDRQRAVNRLGLAAADRRVQHLDALLRQLGGDFAAGQRGDRGMTPR